MANSQTSGNSPALNNALDVGRKWPASSLSDEALTQEEGDVSETVAGVAIGATIELSRPANGSGAIKSILVHDGAGELAPGGAAPAAVPRPVIGTHFSLNPKGPNGVAVLTEIGGRAYTGLSLDVRYQPEPAPNPVGGQSGVTPGP